jgi:hypothetical protein
MSITFSFYVDKDLEYAIEQIPGLCIEYIIDIYQSIADFSIWVMMLDPLPPMF